MNDALSIVQMFVYEFQTMGNEHVAERLLAPDFVDHTPFPGFGGGREDVKRLFQVLRSAFPDLRAEIVEQFANGEMVATRKTFHGTHKGEFLGVPPTGKHMAFRVVDLLRVSDGKMREHWNVVDVTSIVGQLQA
jgi:steroid delta-isomerase-like uncharacterized protein